jgi:transcriptional regulator with XRE-family HTH domain
MNASARQQVAVAFGTVLPTARDAGEICQEQLAEAADVARTYPSLLERGLRQPTLHVLLHLTDAVDIDPGLMVIATAISSESGKKTSGFLWEPKLTSYTVRAVDEKC